MRWPLWLMWVLGIVEFTTMPWSNYVGHSHWDQVRWIPFYDHPLNLIDILANVALFFPFGYLFPRRLNASPLIGIGGFPLLIAAMLSTLVELFQVYCHSRTPSTTDICTNVLGAMLGLLLDRNTHLVEESHKPLD